MKKYIITAVLASIVFVLVSCGSAATEEIETPVADTCTAKCDTVKCDTVAAEKVDTLAKAN